MQLGRHHALHLLRIPRPLSLLQLGLRARSLSHDHISIHDLRGHGKCDPEFVLGHDRRAFGVVNFAGNGGRGEGWRGGGGLGCCGPCGGVVVRFFGGGACEGFWGRWEVGDGKAKVEGGKLGVKGF